MLITKKVELRWNSRNKKRYVNLGYTFTRMKNSFLVKVEDLADGSNVKVEVACDYCGKHYYKEWYRRVQTLKDDVIKNDCCNDCKNKKIIETSLKKYGVSTVLKLDKIKNKISKTNEAKYGCSNPFSSHEIKEKIKKTNLERYGFEFATQNEEIKEKTKQTNIKKYGVECYLSTHIFKGSDNHNWKGGVARAKSERFTSEYVKWRTKVLQRDGYECVRCHKSKSKDDIILNAHHILNWKSHVDKRFDVTNGITLCKECHNEFHEKYLKYNNNQEQIDEFINNYGKKIS